MVLIVYRVTINCTGRTYYLEIAFHLSCKLTEETDPTVSPSTKCSRAYAILTKNWLLELVTIHRVVKLKRKAVFLREARVYVTTRMREEDQTVVISRSIRTVLTVGKEIIESVRPALGESSYHLPICSKTRSEYCNSGA